jgi:DNA invertase Pin-like site-specific DNA recombinase
MSSPHDRSPSPANPGPDAQPMLRPRPAKVQRSHQDRLAIVYVRQSTLQQVAEHKESLARQYALTETALVLGWPADRVMVIDQDLGQSGRSADGRQGFQRLLSEVALDHVGIVLGLEMSRLSRSCKDWHHLLELCAVFNTLLADQDGVYDPVDPNDRLLLGLRGTISEVELHTMRNRLDRGRLHKAQRGELFSHLPPGYVRAEGGDAIELDPDEQVRGVVRLIFDKFDELGSAHATFRYLLRQGIRVGIRPHDGPSRGRLEWRRPKLSQVMRILKHPLYAGAYAYGRCPGDPKRGGRRRWLPPEEWKVLRRDRVPAYIAWERYQRNLERLRENRSRQDCKGCPRRGAALLAGLVVCGRCGRRLHVGGGRGGQARYDCVREARDDLPKTCAGLSAARLDALVTDQVLAALEPAGLELCLRAAEDVERERERLTEHWRQQRERGRYEALQAERRYRAVDAENRLVARTLEQQWEESLRQQRQVEEAYERFRREQPAALTDRERASIRSLAEDIPLLWRAAGTSETDRKEIVRTLLDQVVVYARGDSDQVEVALHWMGGRVTRHALRRVVSRYDHLGDYGRLAEWVAQSKREGLSAAAIADRLNAEGFRPASGKVERFSRDMVVRLFARIGLSRARRHPEVLGANEWWFRQLAEELEIPVGRLRHWVAKGFVHSRKGSGGYHIIVWADADELDRLRTLRDYIAAERCGSFPKDLRKPKPWRS